MRVRHLHRDERGISLIFVSAGLAGFLAATTLAIDVGMILIAEQPPSVLTSDVTFPNDPSGNPTRAAVSVYRRLVQ